MLVLYLILLFQFQHEFIVAVGANEDYVKVEEADTTHNSKINGDQVENPQKIMVQEIDAQTEYQSKPQFKPCKAALKLTESAQAPELDLNMESEPESATKLGQSNLELNEELETEEGPEGETDVEKNTESVPVVEEIILNTGIIHEIDVDIDVLKTEVVTDKGIENDFLTLPSPEIDLTIEEVPKSTEQVDKLSKDLVPVVEIIEEDAEGSNQVEKVIEEAELEDNIDTTKVTETEAAQGDSEQGEENIKEAELKDNDESTEATETVAAQEDAEQVEEAIEVTELEDKDEATETVEADDKKAVGAETESIEGNEKVIDIEINVDEGLYPEPVGNITPLGQYGHRIFYHSEGFKVNYFQANQICTDLGMQLISINSKEENDFLFKTIGRIDNNERYWTSGSNFLTGRNWIWMKSGQALEYTNWMSGEPSESAKKCLEIVLLKGDNLKWNNENCNEKLSFLCEYDGIMLNPMQAGLTSMLGVLIGSLLNPTFNFKKKSYYAISDVELSFFDANRACKMLGLELVSVTSEEENNQLYDHIRNSMVGTNFWSSGIRIKDKTNWYWLVSGKKLKYSNWQNGEPENDDVKCIQMIFDKESLQWIGIDCNKPQNFVCQTLSFINQALISKPEVIESLPARMNHLTPSTIKIKIIPPAERKYFKSISEEIKGHINTYYALSGNNLENPY